MANGTLFNIYFTTFILTSLLLLKSLVLWFRNGFRGSKVMLIRDTRRIFLFLGVIWVLLIVGEDHSRVIEITREYQRLAGLSLESKRRLTTAEGFYDFLMFCDRKLPKGIDIGYIFPEGYYYFKANYYLYPRKLRQGSNIIIADYRGWEVKLPEGHTVIYRYNTGYIMIKNLYMEEVVEDPHNDPEWREIVNICSPLIEKAHKLAENYLEEARLYPDKIVADDSSGDKDRVTNYIVSLGIIPPYAKLYRLASLSEILTLLKLRGFKIELDGEIGNTGIISPIDIMVQSAGFEDGSYARIYLEGMNVSLSRRGYNITVLDSISGEMEGNKVFDTCGSAEASHKLANFIKQIPSGRVVIAAVADEASGSLTEEAVEALRSIGASQSVKGLFRYAHAVIGVKGAPSGTALEVLGDDPVGIVLFGKAEEKE